MSCLHRPASDPGRRPRTAAAFALALMTAATLWSPALWADDRRDHERARAAVAAGDILPLARVLDKVSATHPGEVLEVELEREDGLWVYELRLLTPRGELMKLEVDARDARVLRVRPRKAQKETLR